MKGRIASFLEWLSARPEMSIVIVGHSAFFRDMLDTDVKMRNCEVRECFLTNSGEVLEGEVLIHGDDGLLVDEH